MTKEEKETYHTTAKAAKMLGYTQDYMRQLTAKKTFAGVKQCECKRAWLIPDSEVKKHVRQRMSKTVPQA